MMTTVPTSVIIPGGYESRLPYILSAYNALQNGSIKPSEILVVTHSKTMLPRLQETNGIRVIYDPNAKTATRKRNLGIDASQGEILAFMDDDEIPDANWLQNHVLSHTVHGALVVGGKIISHLVPEWLPREYYWLVGQTTYPDEVRTIRNPWTGNMSISRSALGSIRFNESFGNDKIQGEEPILCEEIERVHGKKALYNPRAIIYHYPDPEKTRFLYLVKRSFWQGYTKGLARNKGYSLEDEKNHLTKILTGASAYFTSPKKLATLALFTGAVVAGYAASTLFGVLTGEKSGEKWRKTLQFC